MNITQDILTDMETLLSEAGALPMPAEGSFDWVYEMARDAATSAALKAHAACNDHADCGAAWVVIQNARSKFVRYLKEQGEGERHFEGGWKISLCGGMRVQSRIIYEEGCRAFVEVLEQHGIEAWVYSYAD
ncbi:hypothetical protein [Pseudovibrio sp. Tun.PSC04-5.I4]|uniref:hypothetical protein n=1 Tax=Pseudovibrio sp. Tun.PSC04-5.I4 TaxID=1798213 RepID=UPI000892791F|nr:hypothetical protein [Pseudovibrio sp. Tun.PSC04-5.I4]SDQ36163.1 hypothetical protein SAMN04515695_0966 [Pseudovibrio sp. Tun.PSC04-5.I4]